MDRIEIMIAFNNENGDLKNKNCFLSLLAINEELKISTDEIIYKRVPYKFSIDTIKLNEEKYNAYIFTLYTKKHDAKYRELIKKVKKTIGPLAKENLFTLWDDMSKKFCCELYKMIYEVENLMRKLIFQFMFEKLGINWQSIPLCQYSKSFRESVLKKVLPPESKRVSLVAEEMGISTVTIYSWIAKVKNGTLNEEKDNAVTKRKLKEKFDLVMEHQKIPDAVEGEWLRKKGLHSEHIPLFEQEIHSYMTKKTTDKDKRFCFGRSCSHFDT